MNRDELLRHERQAALGAATVRALAAAPQVHARGARLYRGDEPLADDDMPVSRGRCDAVAMRLRHSDADLHAQLRPADDEVAAAAFDLFEQLRAEACVPQALHGAAQNLDSAFEAWTIDCLAAGATESEQGLLWFTIAQVVRSRLTGQSVPEAASECIEATRAAMAAETGVLLAAMRLTRHLQRDFAVPATALSHWMSARMAARSSEGGGTRPAPTAARRASHRAFSLWLPPVQPSVSPPGPGHLAGDSSAAVPQQAGVAYRVFSRAYDRCDDATDLVRPALLQPLRRQLDERVAAQRVNVPRLAQRLRRLLVSPADDAWVDGQDSGLVDARRLAGLVAAPQRQDLFRRPVPQWRNEAAVTLLIDCSGSMRRHVEPLAVLADTLVRALDAAGARVELLGFTTASWNGGRALRDWRRAGRPPQPGRLNELQHLVFKSAAQPWRRSRAGIAALLKPDLFREGIDGEAVDWACARLQASGCARRLLLVLSDGGPMDGATVAANDESLLDQHLRAVVARREREDGIAVLGMGLGQDLGRFYRRSIAIDLDAAPGRAVYEALLGMIQRAVAQPRPLRHRDEQRTRGSDPGE